MRRDGKRILFRSTRSSYSRFERLYTVPATGGFPTPLPLPMGVEGSYSPDGTHLAYVPHWNRRLGAIDAYIAIKHYRGGNAAPIWIADLADSSVTRIPREASNAGSTPSRKAGLSSRKQGAPGGRAWQWTPWMRAS